MHDKAPYRFIIPLLFLFTGLQPISALAMNDGPDGPWEGFPRTQPQTRYENDPAADANHAFGVTKAFSPYKDPNPDEALSLPNPLDDPDFSTYNLIVVISKANDDFWGREQTLRVYKRGTGLIYYWLVSTGMQGHETLAGYFSPKAFSSSHWSREYDAPMLWSVFFHGGEALHSSLDRHAIEDMGKAAESHGCVHEEDYRAEEMFHLVGHSGYGPVDQINEKSGRKTGATIMSYRTLIIIGPGPRWDRVNQSAKSGSSQQGGPLSTPIVDETVPSASSTLKTISEAEYDEMQRVQSSDPYGASSVGSVNSTSP
jgi:L,D-transpeptidase catalytic domain